MAKFQHLENAHIFSKAVITPNMEAAASANISAHTIQSKDVWAEEVPFLTSDDIKNITADTEIIKEGYGKVKFYYKKPVYNLVNKNNSNVPSNGYVGKIIIGDKVITQFISPTDVVDTKGNNNSIYTPILYNSSGDEVPLSEYIINASNGLIYDLKSTGDKGIFNTDISNPETKYKLSFFTYEGKRSLEDNNDIKDELKRHKEELTTKATKTDITNLENKIVDKTVRIIPKTDNITADLVETENAPDSYTISVDGYTTDEIDALLENEANKIEEQIAIVAAATMNTIEATKVAIEDKLSSHASSNIHITTDERSRWNTAASKAAAAVQDVTSGNAYLEKDTDNDNITLSLNVDTNLNDGGTANSVPSSTAVTDYGSSIISAHEAKKDEDKSIHVNSTDRDKWDTAATKAGTAIQTLSSHTSDTDIHITTAERSKWNTASQKTDRLSFPTSYTNFNDNDKQCYVTSYGFEYKELIEDAWIQNIEVNVALPELRDSITEYNPISGGSSITPNIIGEKVCKILVTEGLNDDWGENFNKNDDEIELGVSEYNICKKDKNNSSIEILNFTFDQPIFLRANKNYRFYFYDQNENLYALPIMINVDNANNVTTIKKEVAIRCLIDRYDYVGVWNIDKDLLPDSYGLYGLKVKLSKDIYSAFIAHESNSDIHITENERERWDTAIQTVKRADDSSTLITVDQSETTVSVALSDAVATKTDITNLENKADKIEEQIAIVAAATVKTIEEQLTNHASNNVENVLHVTQTDKNNWNTSNIDYKALNKDVTSYKDGILTYGDGTIENINLEKTISAQYAFGKRLTSSAATINEFNLRTIKNDYTADDGANYENDCVVSDDEKVNTLANLINGRGMFLRSNLTTFNDELPCLMLGDNMFKNSTSLSNFRSPLPSLTCAGGMFRGCTSLTTFRTKLPNLSRAKSMFNDDSELTTVDTCLPNLTYGNNMFSNCPKLTTVNLSSTSLSNLYDGTFMFHHDTARDFNKFRGDLSSLETAEYMFTGCRLDLESVTRIADTIRDWSNDNSSPCAHRIGIGINSKSNWTDWNKFEEQRTRITNKGWIIAQWQENGVDPEELLASTYYYAKPAFGYASPEYIDENGNKVTLILTHYTDCKDEYEIVSSREEAEIRFKLTKIEKVEE